MGIKFPARVWLWSGATLVGFVAILIAYLHFRGTLSGLKNAPRSRGKDSSSVRVDADTGLGVAAIPGAVRAPPPGVDEDFPFDASTFFRPVPANENAAPLYLDALFEFDEELARCFPQSQREPRRTAARSRRERYDALEQAREKEPQNVTRQQIDDLLAEYDEGFEKLRRAQRRSSCVFETGFDIDSPLPHGQAARQVSRIVNWRTERNSENGTLDGSLDDLRLMFRLSRDIRHRAHFIIQLVSISIESRACEGSIWELLHSLAVQESHCKQLLAILQEHESEMTDPFVEGLKAECVTSFQTIHDLQHHTGPYDARRIEKSDELDGGAIGRVLEQVAIVVGLYRDARTSMYRFYSEALDLENLPIRERLNSHPTVQAGNEARLVNQLVPNLEMFLEILLRHEARRAGTKCLIALRLWTLRHDGLPIDLEKALQEAGISDVPLDPYSGKPIRFVVRDGTPIIYSIGKDGTDDSGLQDWNYGRRPGDFIFRLDERPGAE